MAPEFIEDNENGYLSAFSSTRNNTNKVSSGFGIGRICALGLVDSYIIKSYYKKKEYIYNLFFSSCGVPELMKIAESDTQRGNGVIIEMAIPANEINNFQPYIQKIFQFFDTKPIIKCGDKIIEVKSIGNSKFKGQNWFIPDSNSGYFEGNYKTPVIWSGCYGYQLDYSLIHDLTDNQRNLLKTGIVLRAPIGDISTNASREAVQLDEKTIKVIKNILNDVLIDLFEKVENEIKNSKTLIEAKKTWDKWSRSEEIYEIRNIFKSFKFVWNGEEIISNFININGIANQFELIGIGNWRSPSKLNESKVGYLVCDNDTVLLHNDVLDPEKAKRIKSYFWSGNAFIRKNNVFCVKTPDLAAFLKEHKIEDVKVIKVSSLEKWKNPNPATSVKSSKSGAKILKWNKQSSCSSSSWDLTDKPKTGVYVNIHRYYVVSRNGLNGSFSIVNSIINNLETLGHKIDLYGVKNSYLNHNLIHLEDYCKDIISKIDVKSFNIEDKIWSECFGNFRLDIKNITTTGPAKQLQDKKASLNVDNNDKLAAFTKLCNSLNLVSNIDYNTVREKVRKEFDELKKSFYSRYAMFDHLNNYTSWADEFKTYIEMVDKLNNNK
jgi:hypothetical protein